MGSYFMVFLYKFCVCVLQLLDISLEDLYFFVFLLEYVVDFFCSGDAHQKN